MTSQADVTKRLRRYWREQVAELVPLPTQYDNLPFDTPSAGTWAAVAAVFSGEPLRRDFGSAAVAGYSVAGRWSVNLYGPLAAGPKALWVLADVVDVAYRSKYLAPEGIALGEPVPEPVGATSDRKWWQLNKSCPFVVRSVAAIP